MIQFGNLIFNQSVIHKVAIKITFPKCTIYSSSTNHLISFETVCDAKHSFVRKKSVVKNLTLLTTYTKPFGGGEGGEGSELTFG